MFRSQNFTRILLFSCLILLGFQSFGEGVQHHETEAEEKYDAKKVIMHHISDAHEFHILGEGDGAVSVYLPIILWANGGLEIFNSANFYHNPVHIEELSGDHAYKFQAESGITYFLIHEKVYQGNASGNLEFHEGHPINLKPLDFSITRNVFSMFLSVLLILIIFLSAAGSYKKGNLAAPKGLASFIEPLVVFVKEDIAIPNIGKHKYERFMPYLLTAFFFIWLNNLIGLIPFFPFSSNLTGNIAFTFTMAALTLIITVINGNKNYWVHIFATPGVPFWLLPIMIPVEIIGVLSKPFALMVRLFANITAGHIVILSLISLIFIFKNMGVAGVSVPFALFISVLELLVAALQAYVFTMLSALFFGQAVEDHH